MPELFHKYTANRFHSTFDIMIRYMHGTVDKYDGNGSPKVQDNHGKLTN